LKQGVAIGDRVRFSTNAGEATAEIEQVGIDFFTVKLQAASTDLPNLAAPSFTISRPISPSHQLRAFLDGLRGNLTADVPTIQQLIVNRALILGIDVAPLHIQVVGEGSARAIVIAPTFHASALTVSVPL